MSQPNHPRYAHLLAEISSIKAKRIIEIGVYRCERAIEMISTALTHGGEVSYTGFDLFEDFATYPLKDEELSYKDPPRTMGESLELLARRFPGMKIELVKGDSRKTLTDYVASVREAPDFVFIDGGHSFDTTMSDWKNIEKIMGANTTVCIDDYDDNNHRFPAARIIAGIVNDGYEVRVPKINQSQKLAFVRKRSPL